MLFLAEEEFDVFLTVDQNIPDQQHVIGRMIVVTVLVAFDSSPVPLHPLVPKVLTLLPLVQPGQRYLLPQKDEPEGTDGSFCASCGQILRNLVEKGNIWSEWAVQRNVISLSLPLRVS